MPDSPLGGNFNFRRERSILAPRQGATVVAAFIPRACPPRAGVSHPFRAPERGTWLGSRALFGRLRQVNSEPKASSIIHLDARADV